MDIQSPDLEATTPENLSNNMKHIILTEDDRQRMYNPWKYSLIIKLMGKWLVPNYLKRKTQELWKIDENIPLIDLGKDYYTVKLAKEESMTRILHDGPWFINGFFPSVQKWVPNFVATKAYQSYTVVWVRLPQLSTEFYDGIILTKIGNYIGKLLKVDACTSATPRGIYARLWVELPLEQPVQNLIMIGHHNQPILYEGEDFLCKVCGRLGHSSTICSYRTTPIRHNGGPLPLETPQPKDEITQEWMAVSFPRKNKSKAANQSTDKASSSIAPGIKVRMYDALSGKHLNT
ncbi:PREDICTED: uncharacterized protein LOC109231737 [Nicotiana attenuata]|uniref:uncharacterized protein LOC109231737 n=1 Tax=Nicotiana attenuata TaxID=49451 RepID=UPI000904806A|nr:PREDICTED: uncharacterized protein LOC109231737 [Nicotiana attenuata]